MCSLLSPRCLDLKTIENQEAPPFPAVSGSAATEVAFLYPGPFINLELS
jgi:hypothetical protein